MLIKNNLHFKIFTEETTDCVDINNSDWIPTINLDHENNVDLVAIVFRNDQTCMSAVDKKNDEVCIGAVNFK